MTTLRELSIAAACIAILLFLVECTLLVHDARKSLLLIATDLHNTQSDYQRVAQEAVGTMAPLRAALKASKDSSEQVAANSVVATSTLNADLVDLSSAIGHLDSLIVSISTDASQVTKQSADSFTKLNATMDSLQPAIKSLTSSMDQLPAIATNLKDTSAQTIVIAQNTASTTHNIDLTSHDIQQYIHRETAPVRGTWNLFKELLGLTYQMRGALAK